MVINKVMEAFEGWKNGWYPAIKKEQPKRYHNYLKFVDLAITYGNKFHGFTLNSVASTTVNKSKINVSGVETQYVVCKYKLSYDNAANAIVPAYLQTVKSNDWVTLNGLTDYIMDVSDYGSLTVAMFDRFDRVVDLEVVDIVAKESATGTLTVTSAAGTSTGKTDVTVASITDHEKLYYQIAATEGELTAVPTDRKVTEAFIEWNGTDEIVCTTGQYIGVVAVNARGIISKYGKCALTAA